MTSEGASKRGAVWAPVLAGATLLLAACSAGGHSGSGPAASATAAEPSVMVGGASMLPSRTIVENAANSKDHTTLVAAVKAAGLVDTLNGPGPFTVFAPTNAAFDKLPQGTVATLLAPANKAKLRTVLTYHVVPGRIDSGELRRRILAGGGKATLTTVEGGTLTAMMNGPRNIVISDAHGDIGHIVVYDVYQSNGVIHSIDQVLLPAG